MTSDTIFANRKLAIRDYLLAIAIFVNGAKGYATLQHSRHSYASEMAWREDNRRVSDGEQYLAVTRAALVHPVSRVWAGYWQKDGRS